MRASGSFLRWHNFFRATRHEQPGFSEEAMKTIASLGVGSGSECWVEVVLPPNSADSIDCV